MSHEFPAQNQDVPSPAGPTLPASEVVALQPEVMPSAPHLSEGQLKLFKEYTQATDRRVEGDDYRGAMERMRTAAEEAGDSSQLGEIAVTAAMVGAMTRDPALFQRSGETLLQRMVHDMDIPREHVGVFFKVQQEFMARRDPMAMGETLNLALKHMDKRQEQHGEDTVRARVALVASGFAATQDPSLRQVLARELEAK